MQKGFFITFEGGEGAGKSTILNMICDYFNEQNIEYISTREPGGIVISEQIREVILDCNNKQMDERCEALLYAAARRQHLVEKVMPALKSGKIVLCDRFIDSSLAYQGHARGIGIDEVLSINSFAIDNKMPDLTIYFDINPKQGLKRISANSGREVNRLDLETIEFHNKVREGYEILLEKYKERIVKVNASESIDNVFEKVKYIINNCLNKQ